MESLNELFQKKKGLSVSLLEVGTKFTIETRNSFYDFVVLEGNKVSVFGGTRKDGSTRFPKSTEAVVLGSTWGGALLAIDWVGQGMFLEFQIDLGVIITSVIKKISVEAPDGSWAYSIEE